RARPSRTGGAGVGARSWATRGAWASSALSIEAERRATWGRARGALRGGCFARGFAGRFAIYANLRPVPRPALRFRRGGLLSAAVKVALVILHAEPAKGGAEGYTVNLAHAL